jgi:hypothetical protein
MKNSDLPEGYKKAIKSKKIEHAIVENDTEKRSRIIMFINAMETINIDPDGIDPEEFLTRCEKKGIVIPNKPYSKLSDNEKRNLSDSLKTIDLAPGNLTPRQKQIWQEFQRLKNKK